MSTIIICLPEHRFYLVVTTIFIVVVKFDEKSFSFEGEFSKFCPTESDDFDGFVFLKDYDPGMGNGQLYGNALCVLDRDARKIFLSFGIDL